MLNAELLGGGISRCEWDPAAGSPRSLAPRQGTAHWQGLVGGRIRVSAAYTRRPAWGEEGSHLCGIQSARVWDQARMVAHSLSFHALGNLGGGSAVWGARAGATIEGQSSNSLSPFPQPVLQAWQ